MKKNIHFILTVLFLLFTAGNLQAQTLEEYMSRAAKENPELQARFQDYYAALKRVPQVGSLPDPQLMIGYFIEPVRSRAGDFNFNASLSQQFPWFGLLRTRSDAAAMQAEAKLKAFEALREEVFFNVKQNWYGLYELEERIRITGQNLELLRFMETQALKKYETGQSPMVDVLRVQMQIKENENRLEKLERNRIPLLSRFNNLLNRQADEAVHVPEALVSTEDPSIFTIDSVMSRNPQIKQLQAKEQAAQYQLKAARLSGYPTLKVGVNYTNVSGLENGDMAGAYNGRDVVQPFIGLNLPLYRKKYKAKQQEAGFELQKVTHEQQVLKNNLQTAFLQGWNNLQNAKEDVTLYSELVIQSEQALNLLTRSYSTADQGFEEVLRMQQQVLNYEMALIKARVAQQIAIARLQMLKAGS